MKGSIFKLSSDLLEERLKFTKRIPKSLGVVGLDHHSCRNSLRKLYNIPVMEIDVKDSEFRQGKAQSSWHRWFKGSKNRFQLVSLEPPFWEEGIETFDVLVSNLYLVRKSLYKRQLFTMWRTFLCPGGWLFFSFLGPESFAEIYRLFDQYRSAESPTYQLDMQMIGDELLQQGFIEPVISSESLHLTYRKLGTLIKDLEDLGVLSSMLSWLNISQHRFGEVLRKAIFELTTFQVTYEFVFAHALKSTKGTSEQEIRFYKPR
ncbi:MAG: hypothetical protein WDW20_05885 [Neisseriaceae bacterium]